CGQSGCPATTWGSTRSAAPGCGSTSSRRGRFALLTAPGGRREVGSVLEGFTNVLTLWQLRRTAGGRQMHASGLVTRFFRFWWSYRVEIAAFWGGLLVPVCPHDGARVAHRGLGPRRPGAAPHLLPASAASGVGCVQPVPAA